MHSCVGVYVCVHVRAHVRVHVLKIGGLQWVEGGRAACVVTRVVLGAHRVLCAGVQEGLACTAQI